MVFRAKPRKKNSMKSSNRNCICETAFFRQKKKNTTEHLSVILADLNYIIADLFIDA